MYLNNEVAMSMYQPFPDALLVLQWDASAYEEFQFTTALYLPLPNAHEVVLPFHLVRHVNSQVLKTETNLHFLGSLFHSLKMTKQPKQLPSITSVCFIV